MALFTKKDLGLLLPDDTPGDPVFKPLKPKVDPSKKVTRYRAGKVPGFAHGYEDDRGFVTANSQVRAFPKDKAQHKPAPVISTGRKRVEAQVISAAAPATNDRGRRERAPSSSSEEEKGSSDEDVAKALQDSSSEEEDDSDIDRRRRMLRNKAKAREAEKEEGSKPAAVKEKSVRLPVAPQIVKQGGAATAAKASAESSSSDGSSSSEYETDTDESEPGEELMKPVFVPKKARGTVKRQEEIAAEEERRQKREQEKSEARKMDSRRLVAEEIRREQDGADKGDSTDVEMPDDTDGLDPAQEYRDWELREMRRIKRKLKKNEPKEKKKLKFMQKYYHKGAFYVDDDSIRSKDDVRKRDADGATLEDKFNKELLPAVMQVKNFGRAGRYETWWSELVLFADSNTSLLICYVSDCN
ncbi:unnamed protein product [Phytophthora fragariaefolia]|uniref:Unnamed protein product n=1 Tax=Phytophthora fragariaefolia TaxID=1490495 RepID=A0A9W6XBN2_9STRA|nr:unnamed protein product [Phytophthora fragariaefolia]